MIQTSWRSILLLSTGISPVPEVLLCGKDEKHYCPKLYLGWLRSDRVFKGSILSGKIYLLGESWGSALGVFLVDMYPDSYHALIGTGQMVDFAETERIDYAEALEIAQSKNDATLMKRLKANGNRHIMERT